MEQEIIDNAPPTVYKYRNWKDENHKNVLLKNHLWFSHPFDLNDPLDVRPDFAYSVEEVESDAFFQHLVDLMPVEYRNLNQKEKESIAKKQWEKIKADPSAHFNANRKQILTRERYEPYGVFSTTIDSLSIPTWEVYGDNHKGYCIGFKTVELARDLQCTTGLVDYNDAPFPYKFIKDQTDQGVDILLYKKTAWTYEKEFRFVTAGIGVYTTRLRTFKPHTAVEVVLGHNISREHEGEILRVIEAQYQKIPVYKTRMLDNGQFTRDTIR